MDDCVTAAVDVLDAVGEERVSWVGLSWGGMVGMRLAARYPERVERLVLMDTSARAERLWKKAAYKPLEAFAQAFGPVRPLGKLLEPIFFSPRTLRANRPIVEAFIETLVAMDPQSLVHAVEAVIFSRRDATEELARIEAPTLVIVGADDRATPPGESEHLAKHIAGARLVRVPDAGHLSALEQPERVNDELIAFLG
jgi:pimeloyl-ACP methyl ester carboxylesterase